MIGNDSTDQGITKHTWT